MVVVFGSLASLSLIAVGFIRYTPGIPRVFSCSIAISGACHVQNKGHLDQQLTCIRPGFDLENKASRSLSPI
ncbi:hypothetical protein PTTW11_04424 [Pyrenophora teres f. teres]|uniref:Uncharacterized protein n=1 Tax=Pyrenophora teres f. teres TaxID=97479 RepID=A0A6S6VZ79_9PLEO|nr:hypothetical protein PTTW11_04424 [Pyrenophora teres f. teres]